jgi:hypothetical protein
VNRRGFCRSAAAGIAMAAINRPSFATALAREHEAPIGAVVYDERYGDAREFAAALQRQGAATLSIGSSSAAIWHKALEALLSRREGRIAGLSTDADLLVARSCAREAGFLPIFEGRHDARGSERVAHFLRMRGAAHLFDGTMPSGGLRIGELALAVARLPWNAGADWIGVETEGPKSQDHPGYLTSWLFAPRENLIGGQKR